MADKKDTSRISAAQFEALAKDKVPFAGQMGISVVSLGDGAASLRLPFRDDFLRPGGTISGPVLMGLADLAMYAAVLSRIGLVEHTLTVTLNITFLRRPQPADVIAEATLFKVGKRLAMGEVALYRAGDSDMVAHVTSTYSIPPGAVD